MSLTKRKSRLRHKLHPFTTDNIMQILEELGWTCEGGSLEGESGKVQFRSRWVYRRMEVIVDKRFEMEKPYIVLQVTPCHPIEIKYAEELKIAMEYCGDVAKIHQEIFAWRGKTFDPHEKVIDWPVSLGVDRSLLNE